VGKLNHPDPGAEFKEPDPPKRLGEQVSKLILGVDVACLDAPFIQAASDEVVPHVDVLAPFVKNGVFCQSQSGLECLSASGGGHYVLVLAAGHGHHLLLA
jgi:hypothetical protein